MEELTRLQPLFNAVIAAGGRPFVVGGFVRDTLLGIPSKDIDVEVHGLTEDDLLDAMPYTNSLGDKTWLKIDSVGKSFGVFKVFFNPGDGGVPLNVDVSLPRTERKVGAGHQDFAVSVEPWLGIEKALARRDFTINAMAFDMSKGGELVDPFWGKVDLGEGVLRHVGPAFSEDPLRVLRAVQFAARFGFEIAGETAVLCKQLVPELLGEISEERLWTEWEKIGSKGTDFVALETAIKAVGLGDTFGDIKARPMHLAGLSGDKRVIIVLAGVGFNPISVGAVPTKIHLSINELQDLMGWSVTTPFRIRQKVRTLKHVTWLDATRIRPHIPIDPWVLEGPLPLPVNGDDLLARTDGKPGKWIGDALDKIAEQVDRDPAFKRSTALKLAFTVWEESLK